RKRPGQLPGPHVDSYTLLLLLADVPAHIGNRAHYDVVRPGRQAGVGAAHRIAIHGLRALLHHVGIRCYRPDVVVVLADVRTADEFRVCIAEHHHLAFTLVIDRVGGFGAEALHEHELHRRVLAHALRPRRHVHTDRNGRIRRRLPPAAL